MEISRLQALIKEEEKRAKDIEDSYKKDIDLLKESHTADVGVLKARNQNTLELFEGEKQDLLKQLSGGTITGYQEGIKELAAYEKERL
jgi:hypothetical protein